MVKPYQTTRHLGSRPKAAESAREKDLWDKIGTLTVPFVTLILGILGWYATTTYNQADLRQKSMQARIEQTSREQQQLDANRITEAQTLERLYEFIASSDPQKREFGYAMFAEMGKGELAARIIEIKQDKAGISVLRTLARDHDPVVAAAAIKGLESLENEVAFTAGGNQIIRQRSSCKDFVASGFRVNRHESTVDDYKEIAQKFGIEPEALAAFMDVEARSGSAVLPDGRLKILFERHIFSRLTDRKFDSSHPEISNREFGGYGAGGAHQYDRLQEAASLNCPAALSATSWGAFQILGDHYKEVGYEFVDDFIKDTMGSGPRETEAAMTFLQNNGILEPLRQKDWGAVARLYNGPAYHTNRYDEKLSAAYAFRISEGTQ